MQKLDNQIAQSYIDRARDGDDFDALNELWEYVNPHMSQRERLRKCTLVMLASHTDGVAHRGRCHVLIEGPGGTGKTNLGKWIKRNINAAFDAGPDSTDVGLKGDASGNDFTPGKLNMAHCGTLFVEELDKFAKSERDALYEAMSDGVYTIDKGEIHREVPAEVRVIAACNDTAKLKPALLDRFDFKIRLEDYDTEATVQVSDDIYDTLEADFINGDMQREQEVIPEYISWIQPHEPGTTADDTMTLIKKMKNWLIEKEGFEGNIREKEAWFRAAYAIAKLNYRDLRAEDYIQAIQLMYPEKDLRDTLELVVEKHRS